jgi:hypothetical protein
VGHVVDVGLRRGLLARGFGQRVGACLVDDLPGLLVGALDDDRRFRTRLLHLVVGARVGFGQFLACTVGGFEAFGDALGALVHGPDDGRPDVFHREPDQDQENDDLGDERGIQAHGRNPLA